MGYLAKGGKKDSLIFLQQAVNPVLLLLYAIYGKLKLLIGKVLNFADFEYKLFRNT